MKQINTILLFIAALLLVFSACQDGNDFGTGYEPSLEKKTTIKDDTIIKFTYASPEKFDIGYPNDTTCTINVTSNEEWTASLSENVASWGWKVDQSTATGNGTVTVTVIYNPTDKQRSAIVTIMGANSKKGTSVTINQPGIKIEVPNPTTFVSSGSSQDLTVNCNIDDWTAISSDESVCTVKKKDSKTLTVTCSKNNTTSQREATVTVKAGEVQKTVDVKQEPYIPDPYTKVTSDDKIQLTSPAAATPTITVESNEEWTATLSENGASWGWKVDQSTAIGNGTVTVTVTNNPTISPRSAIVTIKGTKSGTPTIVEVTQPRTEPWLKTTPESELSLDVSGKAKDLKVESNTTWTISITYQGSEKDWLNNIEEGTGNKTLSVSAKTANTSITERKATLTFDYGGSNPKTVEVTQAPTGPYIIIEGDDSPFSKDGEERTYTVSTNDSSFTVEGTNDWCTLKSKTDNSITIMVMENGTFSPRETTITVTSKGWKTDKLKVTQEANSIEREDYGDDEKKI